MDKSIFMDKEKGPSSLPESCKNCYGFNNWASLIKEMANLPYEDRDCTECKHKPQDKKK